MSERCLVILPTYNVAAHLPALVEQLIAVGDAIRSPRVDLLIVDDHSPDGTGFVADDLKAAHGDRVAVLHRLDRLSRASAYVVGFRYALASGYEYAVQMASDRSHDPNDLPILLHAICHGDLVLGSCHLGRIGWPKLLWNRPLHRAVSGVIRSALGLSVRDLGSGFRCFRCSALATLDLKAVGRDDAALQIEVLYRFSERGLRIVEAPIVCRPSRRLALSPIWRTGWQSLLALVRITMFERLVDSLRVSRMVGQRERVTIPVRTRRERR